jgi:hypothetical protein
MNKCFIFLTLLLSLSLSMAFAGNLPVRNQPDRPGLVRQAFMERSPGQFDPAAYLKNQQETFSWLMAEAVPLSPGSIITIHVTEEDLASIADYQCKNCGDIHSTAYKVRIGVTKIVGVPISLSFLTLGSLERTSEGGVVWTAAVESPGATALRLHFTNFSLPPHSELYIYNLSGEVFGPYTGLGPADEGDFWTNTVSGSVAVVQLRQFGPPTESDLRSTHFTIEEVGYLGEKFLLPFLQQLEQYHEKLNSAMVHCSYNEPCVEDASCYSGSAINDAKYAVAHMQWVSGAWLYYCSGGLVADTAPASQIPYFLTANHCISRAKPAKSLECYWQYWTDSCHGACYDPVGVVPRTLGADILSSNKTGDYTLMQLWENPPGGSVFMGRTS